MFQHLLAGSLAIAFASLVSRASRTQRRNVARKACSLLAMAGLGLMAAQASAADTFAEGTTVRIRSNSIEAGWHTGRITRDQRSCWFVHLDRPTQHGYTLLALMVVDALQLGRTGQWTAVDAKRAIASEPQHCLVEGSD